MKLEGVPEGYEAVRFGMAKEGELFVTIDGKVCVAECDHEAPRLIVRKLEPIATWKHGVFADCWIAEDQCGELYTWKRRPRCRGEEWVDGDMIMRIDGVFNIVQPGVFKFRDDLPWTERCVQVGPSVENQQ